MPTHQHGEHNALTEYEVALKAMRRDVLATNVHSWHYCDDLAKEKQNTLLCDIRGKNAPQSPYTREAFCIDSFLEFFMRRMYSAWAEGGFQ